MIQAENIVRGNKFIAEFMGHSYDDHIKLDWMQKQEAGHRNPEIMQDPNNYSMYHNSWEWIMEVVERIHKLKDGQFGFSVRISKRSTAIFSHKIWPTITVSKRDGDDMLFNTWTSVIEFIEWHKNQPTP